MYHRHALIVAALLLAKCDPEKDALRILSEQGLYLLKPARTYVEIGGIVVLPRGSRAYYVDRLDGLPHSGAQDAVVDFGAVLLKETKSKNVSLGSAIGAIQSIIPLPLNVAHNSAQLVELSQITSTGQRLRFESLQSLIRTGNTSRFLEAALASGRKDRLFVVWEVYRAQSLTLKSSRDLNIGLGVSASVPAMPTPSPTASATQASQASPSSRPTPAPQSSASPSPSPGSSATPKASPSIAIATPGSVSGTWTRRSQYELSLTGAQSYPFAVRLAEVRRGKDGLELVPGGFRFKGTLAAGTNEERFTALPAKDARLILDRRTGK